MTEAWSLENARKLHEWSDWQGSCAVCYKLDKDPTPKPVKHCGLCDAWMCEPCFGDYTRRRKAAIGHLISTTKRWVGN